MIGHEAPSIRPPPHRATWPWRFRKKSLVTMIPGAKAAVLDMHHSSEHDQAITASDQEVNLLRLDVQRTRAARPINFFLAGA